MPITIPIPDARFRAAMLDRARRGRELPFRAPRGWLRALWTYRPTRWAAIAGLVGLLASTATPGWLPLVLTNVGLWWSAVVAWWLVVRAAQAAQRRLYIIGRAQRVRAS